MRVLLCDDDSVVRSVVRHLAEDAGLEVVGEAATASEASEMLGALSPDVVVVDLSLTAGVGDSVIAEAAKAPGTCKVVVFSAFAADPARLLRIGAAAVIAKPDFQGLADVLQAWAADAPPERRRDRPVRSPGPDGRSPSGLVRPDAFYEALSRTQAGDAVVAFRIAHLADRARRDGSAIAADWVLLLARTVLDAVRPGDHLTSLDLTAVHALLHGSGHEGIAAVADRVDATWRSVRSDDDLRVIASGVVQDGSSTTSELLDRLAQD